MSGRNADDPPRRRRVASTPSDNVATDSDVMLLLRELTGSVDRLVTWAGQTSHDIDRLSSNVERGLASGREEAAELLSRIEHELSALAERATSRSEETAEVISRVEHGVSERARAAEDRSSEIAQLLSKIERRLSTLEDRHKEAESGQAPAAQADTDDPSDKVLEAIANKAAHTGDLDLRQIVPQVAASDVAGSVEDFHSVASTLAFMQRPYPMVELASIGWAPLDLGNSVASDARLSSPGSRARVSPAEMVDLAQRAPDEAKRMGMRFNTLPVPHARTIFASLLARFLRPRVERANSRTTSDMHGSPHQGNPLSPGLEVVVHTNRPGLRIFYAPIYFPATCLVFGNSLSTPVRGYLDPGIYIFGAEGAGMTIFEDTAPRRIPPDHDIYMLHV